MAEAVNVLLDFITQFTGSQAFSGHNVVPFGLATIVWTTLLIFAIDRFKDDNPPRERLFPYAFSLGIIRELLMVGLTFIHAMGLADNSALQLLIPPLRHFISALALFAVVAAFVLFHTKNRARANRLLAGSVVSLIACTIIFVRGWNDALLSGQIDAFSLGWYGWIYPINAAFWLLLAMFMVDRSGPSYQRSLIVRAFLLCLVSVVLTLPDIWLQKNYAMSLAPLQNGFYLVAILLFSYSYLYRQSDERKKGQQQILNLAYYDSLTGLPNRALFLDRLHQTLALAGRAESRFAVLFLDLDRFKAINDTYGHSCGDQLLIAVAKRLDECLRQGDTLARLGGDEFVILLPDIGSTSAAVAVAEKVLERMRSSFPLEGVQILTSTSIGVAFYPENGTDPETLLKHADIAMYAAKEQGRECYHLFSDEMHLDIIERHQVAQDLRQALQRGEFVLHYQPQVDINSLQIVGAEALVRWNHPSRGLLLPDQFIPIAEETGLIQPLGIWIFRTACMQLKKWLDQGFDNFNLAINLSAHRLEYTDFLEKVEKILMDQELNPQLIELELTESTMLTDSARSFELLNHLKLRGFTLSMDDFGTGFSSLSYLRRFPFTQVKIDRSFIAGLDVNKDDTIMIKAILSMARNLGLTVVAEGVETYEQLVSLKKLGCARAQGFYFSRPLPAAKFTRNLFSSSPADMLISL